MMWNGYGMGVWGAGMMVVSSLLFLAVVIGLAFLFYRLVRSDWGATDQTADRMLAQRYARGEIDDQEYQHRLTVMHRR